VEYFYQQASEARLLWRATMGYRAEKLELIS
jgi:hypothetical protein